MLESKFSISESKRGSEKIGEIFTMITELLYGIGIEKLEKKDKEPLISAFDYMIRACGMYNDIVQQVLENKEIYTADPESYIKKNVENSYTLVKLVHDKYKHLSRYGK